MKETDVIALLKQYPVCKKFLDSQAYAKEYFNPDSTQEIDEKERYEARIHAIESLIHLLEPSDEYTLLHLHYIKGICVEKCAECIGVSRRTAYRMLKKAHGRICDFINKKGKNDERSD